MFTIEFTTKAEIDLSFFKKGEQVLILDGIETHLRYEPLVATRNRKQLRPNVTAAWELRLGQYRVFYDVAETVRIVSIEAIGVKTGSKLHMRGEETTL